MWLFWQIMLNELRDRPIFICGHPKSGTSLLRADFDSHPQLVVYPEETVFFRRFLPQTAGLELEAQLELADRLLIHIFQWNQAVPVPSQEDFPGRDYSAVSYEEVRQAMRKLVQERYQHPGDLLSAAVLAYGQASGQVTPEMKYWVEKSPYNEYYAEQIFAWWPGARCIHILRDPRDNFASYRRKHPDWQAEFFASNWNRSTQAGVENQERFGSERYRILRYEDLTQSPEACLKELVSFLQVDWDVSLTAPTRAGQGWAGNSMFAQAFQGISDAPVARWKENLSAGDAAVIEWMAKPLLETFQYPLSQAVKGASRQTLATRWRAASWPIRRRLYRMARPLPPDARG
jgi:hypothetical protein